MPRGGGCRRRRPRRRSSASRAPSAHALATRAAARAPSCSTGRPDAAWRRRHARGSGAVEAGPLTPDQIVYAGSWPLWLDAGTSPHPTRRWPRAVADAVAGHVATDRRAARSSSSSEGLGVLATGAGPRQAETARELYLDATRVGRGALALGGVRALAPAERQFIENWEAEAYRRGIDAQ